MSKKMPNRESVLRELEFLASAPNGAAQDRWLKLMDALGFARPGSSQLTIGTEKVGYLDVVEVVRAKKWKALDDPMAYIAKAAKRHHDDGEHGRRGGIVTARGAHEGHRDPYKETAHIVDRNEVRRASQQVAREMRLANAPRYQPLVDRFPEQYRTTYELSPEDRVHRNHREKTTYGDHEDCEGPLQPERAVDFEGIARDQGFDEFSRRVLLYRVYGVSREKALKDELELHGRFTMLALQNAWKDVDRHKEWDSFQRAIKRAVHPASGFEGVTEVKRAEDRRRRNESRGLLCLEEVAKQLGLRVSEVDVFVRSRQLRPIDGLIPPRFHPLECDRFAKKYIFLQVKVIDDSASNLAIRARNGSVPLLTWPWSAGVTKPVPTCKGKSRISKK